MMDNLISEAAFKLAEAREETLRDVARSYLPRPLRRLVDHPRALRLAYRLRPKWRPTIVTGTDGGITVAMTTDADRTRFVVTETFHHERT